MAGGDVDADGFDEITTGAGPGPINRCEVKGFDLDGGTVSPLMGFDVVALPMVYGAAVGLAALDGDGRFDLLVGAGPDPTADSTALAFGYTGSGLVPRGISVQPFSTMYGVRVAGGALGF